MKRLKIGLLFNFQPTWMGGITYIINLVKTFNYLKDEDKPEITLFYSADLKKHIGEFQYPYLKLIEQNAPSLIKGFLLSFIKRKNVFVDDLVVEHNLDAIYPARNYPVKSRTKAKIVAWYADLQHKYYPKFFTRETLVHRAVRLFFMLKNSSDLVVSSRAVLDDFYRFYKIRKELNIHVFHFVSINKDFESNGIEQLRGKYNLPENYFMVSNQFHKHKNHKVLLLALARLNEIGIKKYIAMTGSFPQATNSQYIAELHELIEKHNLSDQINFLGLIPRADQIQLMKNCQAIIQPSLFEGWSTVIEDAISIQVPVIAANLPVNIEQLGDKAIYFEPHKDEQLSDILCNYPERDFHHKPYGNYDERIVNSVEILMKVFVK
ncbi:glycosyltransferase family 4 protein [Plebeiibacterium marinum]|uniref:Glycosyltransferase family 4 protein n=1 Tax=Plebeiibacterium marinum TaxID=2992111 RepID=A0AAE3MAM7_9BACT|nr:glycosyltransferase family 1 protein [Plebeiobacterium marinum]MCW3804139.1 glycosyltransferase family 4 protein [Plebeiobacterium marinum]